MYWILGIVVGYCLCTWVLRVRRVRFVKNLHGEVWRAPYARNPGERVRLLPHLAQARDANHLVEGPTLGRDFREARVRVPTARAWTGVVKDFEICGSGTAGMPWYLKYEVVWDHSVTTTEDENHLSKR